MSATINQRLTVGICTRCDGKQRITFRSRGGVKSVLCRECQGEELRTHVVSDAWLKDLKRTLESAHAGTIGHREELRRAWDEVCGMLREVGK